MEVEWVALTAEATCGPYAPHAPEEALQAAAATRCEFELKQR